MANRSRSGSVIRCLDGCHANYRFDRRRRLGVSPIHPSFFVIATRDEAKAHTPPTPGVVERGTARSSLPHRHVAAIVTMERHESGKLLPLVIPHVLVYRLYGHYSFNARDGGEAVKLVVSDGYSVGEWFNGGKMIVGLRAAMSVEQAIHHGIARIIK